MEVRMFLFFMIFLMCACSSFDKVSLVDGGTNIDVDGGATTDIDIDTDTETDTVSECYPGDAIINSLEDFESVDGYTCIDGDLLIHLGGLPCVDLEGLVFVTGDVYMYNGPMAIDYVDLSDLEYVGGSLDLELTSLIENDFDLRRLRYVGSGFHIDLPMVLESVRIDDLEFVGGSFSINAYFETTVVKGTFDIQAGRLEHIHNLSIFSSSNYLADYAWLETVRSLSSLYIGYTNLANLEFLSSVETCYQAAFAENDNLPYCEVCNFIEPFNKDLLTLSVINNKSDACGSGLVINCD
jgi:hypothetical protein